MVGFCSKVPTQPVVLVLTQQERVQRHCRLHLLFVALCQSISLGRPIPRKSIPVHPHQLPWLQSLALREALDTRTMADGGDVGSRTPVFPPLLLPVNN